MNTDDRVDGYIRQNERARRAKPWLLTPPQVRRANKKLRRQERRRREADAAALQQRLDAWSAKHGF